MLGAAFGTAGTPINKTALLLELQARIDSLNATNLELQSEVDLLNASLLESQNMINELNATVLGLQPQIDTLNYTLTARLNVLEGRLSTLENRTITWNSTLLYWAATTETINWIDVEGLSVNVSVNQTCYLLVMLSTEGYSWVDQFKSGQIYIRAKIDSTVALPEMLYLNSKVLETGFDFLPSHYHRSDYGTYGYDFKPQLVTAGSHTVQIQWKTNAGTAQLICSTLTVIALPIP